MANLMWVEVKGLKELQAKLEELGAKGGKQMVRPALVEWGKQMVNYMIDLAPARTHFMTRHLDFKVRMKGGDAIAGTVHVGPTNAKYPDYDTFDYEGDATARGHNGKVRTRTARMVASWLEFGTEKMAARPFMRPALARNVDNLIEFVSKTIKERLGLK